MPGLWPPPPARFFTPGRRLFGGRKTHCAPGTLNGLLWLQGRSIGSNLSGDYERHHLTDNLRAWGIPSRTRRGEGIGGGRRNLRPLGTNVEWAAEDETNSSFTVGFLHSVSGFVLRRWELASPTRPTPTAPPTQIYYKTFKRPSPHSHQHKMRQGQCGTKTMTWLVGWKMLWKKNKTDLSVQYGKTVATPVT